MVSMLEVYSGMWWVLIGHSEYLYLFINYSNQTNKFPNNVNMFGIFINKYSSQFTIERFSFTVGKIDLLSWGGKQFSII